MKRYVNSALVCLFGISVAVSACKSGDVVPADLIRLGTGQSGRLASGLVVRVDSISDSRCPTEAVCIWEGNVNVSMLISTVNDSAEVKLILGPDLSKRGARDSDSTNVRLDNQTYRVILRDVTPYPKTITQLVGPKTAVVQVSRL